MNISSAVTVRHKAEIYQKRKMQDTGNAKYSRQVRGSYKYIHWLWRSGGH